MAKHSEHSVLSSLIIILASGLCGFGVWLVVQFTETEEINLNVEVIPIGVDSSVDLSLKTREVLVRFSYPRIETQRMKAENFFVEMDFSDLQDALARKIEDSGELPVYEEMVQSRFDSASLNILPVSVLKRQVRWEASLRTVMAKIKPRHTGRPAEGFVAAEGTVEQGKEEVRVLVTSTKQRELVQAGVTIPEIDTEPVNLTGARDQVVQVVRLRYAEGFRPMPGTEDRPVTVIFDVREETRDRRIEGVPVDYRFVSSGRGLIAEVRPSRIDVLVTGRRSVVEAIQPGDIRFTLFGVTERAGESTEVPVEVVIPDVTVRESLSSVASEPRTVTVTITADTSMMTPTPAPPLPPPADIFDDDTDSSPPLLLTAPDVSPTPSPAPADAQP